MPLDFDDDDEVTTEEELVTEEVKVKSKSTKYPKGQRVVITVGPYEGETGAIEKSRISSSKEYHNLKVLLDTTEEVISIVSTSVRYAGANDRTKELSLARRRVEEKKAKKESKEEEVSETQDPEIEKLLAKYAESLPVGSTVKFKDDADDLPGVIVGDVTYDLESKEFSVLVDWEDMGETDADASMLIFVAPPEEVSDGNEEADLESPSEPSEVPIDSEEDSVLLEEESSDESSSRVAEGSSPVGEQSPGEPSDSEESSEETGEVSSSEPPDPLSEYIGLADSLEVAEIVGLPINFKIDNIGYVIGNLRDIIGLPVGANMNLIAEKIQLDHETIAHTEAGLNWALKEAETTFESWFAAQINREYQAQREDYSKDYKEYKAGKIDRPLAPNREFIKSMIKGDPQYLKLKRAINRISYWKELFEKAASKGHDRKAMMFMNINKASPQETVQAGRTGHSYSPHIVEEDEDFGEPGEIIIDDDGEDETSSNLITQEPANEPELYGGKGSLFPWLLDKKPEETSCNKCQALVYTLDQTYYDADETLHSKTCPGDEQKMPSEKSPSQDVDDDFFDIEVDFDAEGETEEDDSKNDKPETKPEPETEEDDFFNVDF